MGTGAVAISELGGLFMKKRRPKIKSKTLPGKKARQIVQRDENIMSPSMTRSYPLVAVKAQGPWITDPDGNQFLDFTCGLSVTNTGHCHPTVVKAIQKQAEQLIHMSGTDFYYEVQVDLAEKLAKIAPLEKGKKRVFYCNSGAESVEAALKCARYHTKRQKIIAFLGAFHGRTMGALSLTGSKSRQKERFSPLVPGVTHVPYATCYRCPYNLKYPSCDLHCAKVIEEEYFKTVLPPEEVAAIVVEPIQGEGGINVPPPTYHAYLRKLTKKYNIMLIEDEVQMGMGRTGEMFAINHWKVKPDMVTSAKGIASGLPLGALITTAKIMDWKPGSHASTFGGNPISCAAALATIQLLEKQLIKNVKKLGPYLGNQLEKLKDQYEIIGDVRGKGFMWGVELVKDRVSKKRAIKERDKIVDLAFKKGLLIIGTGDCAFRVVPPLVATKSDIDVAIDILDQCFKEL